ncbi:hypothetical protein, variant [Loa loa]|uniref:Uncharacterized protein n=1 Tax=Loa loa TaxID=7209 RepID=A0A1S0UKU7_LOALO|nr:hypothetical protein, variant [Loa loa]EJD76330.1 hypothetical protein, variant [Loa loa]
MMETVSSRKPHVPFYRGGNVAGKLSKKDWDSDFHATLVRDGIRNRTHDKRTYGVVMSKALVDSHMYCRQMERGRRLRRGMVPKLERRTVWRDHSLSPAVERSQYAAETALDCYQKRPERRDNFMMNESSSPSDRQRRRYRERLNSNSELNRSTTRISSTSVRTGPMENREYLEHELTKHYRVRDRPIALERVRNEGIRLHDDVNRNVNQIQPSECGGARLQNYHMQIESQLAAEETAGKISNSLANWRIEDLLGGQSILNADSIQNAQTWIANDNSLSPAQVLRARELLQELLVTITMKPDVPAAGRFMENLTEDRPPNFFTDRRVSDCIPSRSFSQQNIQSTLRNDTAVYERELPVMQNSLPVGVPLALPTQNWCDDSSAVHSDSGEIPMSSRDMPKNSNFRLEKRRSLYHDRRRTSRSRSRSLGKDYDTGFGKRRVHMKSRGFIDVRVNHLQKGSRRNYFPHETIRNHHRESRGERSLRYSSPLIHATKKHRR